VEEYLESEGSPRVAFFSWTAMLGKILTIDALRKRGLIIVDWCCMCKQSGENVDHLLLHYKVAHEVWSMVFAFFGVQWVMNLTIQDLFSGWSGSTSRNGCVIVWQIVPHCVIWCLWLERNARHFEDSERTIPELKRSFSRLCMSG
jgi:hypothetical protein